jgi:hypothetical protein
MALGWLTALKAVPWADVVHAAPSIVQGARKLYAAARGHSANQASTTAEDEINQGSTATRLRAMAAALEQLRAEQRSSAELIRSLAEQHARMVSALETLRKRLAVMLSLCVILSVVLIALAAMALAGR